MAQQQQLYELLCKAGHTKGKKTPEDSKALEARVAWLEAKTENSCNESSFAYEKPKANNRNNPALDRNRADPDRANPILDGWAIKRRQLSQQSKRQFY